MLDPIEMFEIDKHLMIPPTSLMFQVYWHLCFQNKVGHRI